MAVTEVRGRFVWHELLTTDVAAARTFYPGFMNWTPEASGTDASYTLWMVGGSPVGGMMALPEEATAMGAPPNWLTYIGTADVDATVRRAGALGAQVLKAPDSVAGAGRFAVLADPQGAVFGVLTPEMPAPTSSPLELGEFSWHELASTDPVGAFRFYSMLFGWQKTGSSDMGPAGLYQMFGWDSGSRGGIYLKPADLPAPSYWLPYALVPNADLAAKHATAAGGKVINGPTEVPGGDRIAVLCDPKGAAFAVHAKAAKASRRRKKPARKQSPQKTLKTRRRRATRKKAVRKRPARRPRRPRQPKRAKRRRSTPRKRR